MTEAPPLWAAVLAAAVLVLAHVVTPTLHFLGGIPRSVWLSVAGGVSVAYVFLHLLPELSAGQEAHARAAAGPVPFAERSVYLIALAGLVAFFGLEIAAHRSRARRAGGADETASARVFWLHMASFGVYNALIGYLLLHLERRTLPELALYTVALALHFVVTDFGLEEDHRATFRRVGRWLLAGALLAGFAAGLAVEISEAAVAALVAFVAGAVIMNVIKEEMPQERRSRFWAFLLGTAGYSALLLAA